MVETKRTSLEQSALSTNYKTLSLRIESIRNIYLNSQKIISLIILIYLKEWVILTKTKNIAKRKDANKIIQSTIVNFVLQKILIICPKTALNKKATQIPINKNAKPLDARKTIASTYAKYAVPKIPITYLQTAQRESLSTMALHKHLPN